MPGTVAQPMETLATRLSGPLAPLDGPANAITDAMNAAVPWLWWPLDPPPQEEAMGAGAHVLYVAHGLAAWLPVRRRVPVPVALAAAGVGWLWWTGAWDRRAVRPAGRPAASG